MISGIIKTCELGNILNLDLLCYSPFMFVLVQLPLLSLLLLLLLVTD